MTLARIFVVLVLGAAFIGPRAFAEAQSEAERARDEEIAQKVKTRQYPGGRDESDLKLQTPMPTPTRKVAPPTDDEQKPETGGTED